MIDNLIKILSCPISYQIFNEPIILSDGITYEKDIVINFIAKTKISPFTGKYLTDNFNCLTINYKIRDIIDIFRNSKLISKNDIYNNTQFIFDWKYFQKFNKIIFGCTCKNEFSKIIFCHNCHKKILKIITCPITNCVFDNPVVLLDGNTYEKNIIFEVLYYKKKSLDTNNYKTNFVIKQLISELIDNNIILKNIVQKKKIIFKDNFFENKCYCKKNKIIFQCNLCTKKLIDNKDKYINYNNWTIVHFVCKYSTFQMIKYIIKKNINLNVKNKNLQTPLDIIKKRNDYKKILKFHKINLFDKNHNHSLILNYLYYIIYLYLLFYLSIIILFN